MNVDELLEFVIKDKKETNQKYVERINEQRKNKTSCFSVVVQKGGVGKTTLCSNIAYTLAQKGFKVLAIDSDSQGSLSGLLNVYSENIEDTVPGLAEVYDQYLAHKANPNIPFNAETIKQYITHPTYPELKMEKGDDGKLIPNQINNEFGFDLLAGDLSLSDTDIFLHRDGVGGLVLFQIINIIKKEMDYDYIIIDCPPALGILAYNAIAASTEGVIVPVNLEVMTIRGAKNIIRLVAEIQEKLGAFKRLNIIHRGIIGIVMNEYQKRSRTQKIFKGQLDMWYPLKKFETQIPMRAACNAAHLESILFAQKSKEAREIFENLCNEIIVEDIRRGSETESVIVSEIGEAYIKLNEMIKENQNTGVIE